MRWQKLAARLTVVVTILLIILTVTSTAWAVEYKVLYKFRGLDRGDGMYPWAGLTLDAAGNLYGTTPNGGSYAAGTVFKLRPNPDGSWSERVIHSFNYYADGAYPAGAVMFDAAGNLYGTTSAGGANDGGTVFKLTPNPDESWTISNLHDFEFSEADGGSPHAGLIFDPAGNLYGTTAYGGSYWAGTAFKLTPNPDGSWSESIIYSFGGSAGDARYPGAKLIFDLAGNLYGTTAYGGAFDKGTAFKLTPSPDRDWSETVIHSFRHADGVSPQAGLVLDTAGNLYGTTLWGGVHHYGTVFKLSPDPDGSWTLSKLHQFNGPDGENPHAGLILNAVGNLYGTTTTTVFKLAVQPDGGWKLAKLHAFNSGPAATLAMDAAGNLYGTTCYGGRRDLCPGTGGCGLAFKIKP